MVNERLVRLIDDFNQKRIDRRLFLMRAAALGVAAAAAGYLRTGVVTAQDATPEASPGASPSASPSASPAAAGTEPGTRSVGRADFDSALKDRMQYEEPQYRDGQVIVPTSSDFRTLNAVLADDATSFFLVQNMFETLVGLDPTEGVLVPGLLDYWEFAADGVTYTFHLPQNATWHDGQPLTAEDVKFSYDMTLNELINNSYRSSIMAVTESYRVVDQYTFEVTAKPSSVTFLSDSPGSVFVVPRHIWESVPPEQWENDPGSTGDDPARVIGSGPFKFGSRTLGDSATLLRYDDYWAGPANIAELIGRVVPDTAAEIQALRNGEVDIVSTVSFSQVAELQATPGLRVDTFPTGTFWYYITNLDPAITTLFQDKRVRQALFYAINRQAIVDNITLTYAVVAEGTQPVLSIAYDPARITTKYNYDPERAKQLLAEAGWVDSDGDGIVEKDGQPFNIEWLSVAGIGEYETMLPAIQEWWRAIGVNMEPQFVDFPTLLDTQNTHQFQIMNLAFSWSPPFWDQGPMFRTDSYEGGFNYMKYSNPEFDALDDQQRVELDAEKRREILIQQNNIVNEDLPVGVLLFRDQRVAFSDRLHNYIPTTLGTNEFWSLGYTWVEES